MKFLLKLFRILKRAKFCSPPRSNVAVFDSRSDILKKMILQDVQFSVLPADFGLLYISFPILYNFVKNFFKIYFKLKGDRRLFLLYLLSCIQNIRPKVVITFIDNNCIFHVVRQLYTEAEFYAIQNGERLESDVRALSRQIPRLENIFSMSNFVCFGEYEVDLYRKSGHSVDKFHPVGALIGGYYWSQVRPPDIRIEFTLCLISQWRKQVMLENRWPEQKKGFLTLNNYLLSFINENEIYFCIAAASNAKEELEYYKNIFANKAVIIPNNIEQFSTYFAMDKSKIILTNSSTAGYESFGWGKKVLFCNFSGDSEYDFPVSSFNSINSDSYEEFKDKLKYLIEIDDIEYSRLTLNARKYVMNYDFNMPAHNYMRKIILKQLNQS